MSVGGNETNVTSTACKTTSYSSQRLVWNMGIILPVFVSFLFFFLSRVSNISLNSLILAIYMARKPREEIKAYKKTTLMIPKIMTKKKKINCCHRHIR